jgi:hypothetical protein
MPTTGPIVTGQQTVTVTATKLGKLGKGETSMVTNVTYAHQTMIHPPP